MEHNEEDVSLLEATDYLGSEHPAEHVNSKLDINQLFCVELPQPMFVRVLKENVQNIMEE